MGQIGSIILPAQSIFAPFIKGTVVLSLRAQRLVPPPKPTNVWLYPAYKVKYFESRPHLAPERGSRDFHAEIAALETCFIYAPFFPHLPRIVP